MAKTTSGKFPIGFRKAGILDQKDLAAACRFAQENDFECLDIGPDPAGDVGQIVAAGLRVGTVDLLHPWDDLAAADSGQRNAAVDRAAEHVKSCVAAGAKNFFIIVFPEDAGRKRSESFGFAVEGYGRLCAAVAATGAKIAVEGYPGSAPLYGALVCTPETYRAFFKGVGSEALGVNFDPSHLIRIGIDPVRFMGEFGRRVWHVHAKDTIFIEEGLYEFGNLQAATFARKRVFGEYSWRYALPGRGGTPWPRLLGMLEEVGYPGCVSVELEDEDFNGSEEEEMRGLVAARDYLKGV